MSVHIARIVHGARALALVRALVAGAILVSVAAAQADVVGWGRQVFDTRWKSEDFVAIDAGESHVLALRPDGSVVAWGNNAFGECEVPPLAAGLTYVQVSAGYTSSAVRSDGQIVTWGSTHYGDGAAPALPPGTSYLSVSTGDSHRVALRSDGQAVCWGNNNYGQCDVPPLPAGMTYIQVSAGGWHTLALRSDRAIVAWGLDSHGQASPPPTPPGKLPVAIDTGSAHSAVLYDDAALACWGNNSHGQCDIPALAGGLTWRQVSLGNWHSLGLVSDGTVRNWGLQGYELADLPSLPPGVTFTQVSAGLSAFSLALRSDQHYVAWGSPYLSQTNAHTLPSGVEPSEVVAAAGSTMVIGSDGSVTAWGTSLNPQLPAPPTGSSYVVVTGAHTGYGGVVALRSDGQIVTAASLPAPALPAGTVYTDVAAGGAFYLALRSDGEIVPWGSQPSLPWMMVPALPLGLVYTAVSGGNNHGIALRSDGSVVCWGVNDYGQLDVPVLPAGTIYVEVEAGNYVSLARRSDGALVQWGRPTGSPPTLDSGASFVDVDLGAFHGLARVSDGSVVSWGLDLYGETGVPSPAGGEWLSAASAGTWHSAAVRGSGAPCGSSVTYCGTPTINSSGAAARLQLAGCAGLTANDLSLELAGLPPGQLGILIYSTQVAAVPFGDGTLCLGGPIVRVPTPLVAGASGTASLALDLTQPPFASGQGQVLPGSNWNFQFWYRDPAAGGAGYNLSDAAHVVFAP